MPDSHDPPDPSDVRHVPYKLAVLCYLYDAQGRLLLLHRLKEPNSGMYSPIGGKLETGEGEGPHDCALREIREEAGIVLGQDQVRLSGIVSERAYPTGGGRTHWLIFLFEVTRAIRHDEIANYRFEEGELEWVDPADVASLPIPDTDRRVMWPHVQSHRGGFFMVHIDCAADPFTWRVTESRRERVDHAESAGASRGGSGAAAAPRTDPGRDSPAN